MSATLVLPVSYGFVVDAFSHPVPGAIVRVVWPRYRSEVVLGETTTGKRGEFSVELKLPDGVPTDVRVHVVALRRAAASTAKSGKTAAAGRRKPDAEAGASADLGMVRTGPLALKELSDLTLRLPSNELDAHSRLMVQARASLGGLELCELREDAQLKDISMLAADLGTVVEGAMGLVMASRVADLLDLPEAAVFVLMTDAASGLPSSLLEASDGFKLIDALTGHVADAISVIAPESAEAAS